MPRLIDADALTEHFRLHMVLAERRGFNESIWAWQGAILDVEDMPTIDTEPVRHGRWILRGMHHFCSACGEQYDQRSDNFCAECGAKMDLEVQHAGNV